MDRLIVNCIDCGIPFYLTPKNKYSQCYHCWADDIERIFE